MATRAQGTIFRFTPAGGEAATVGKLSSVGEIRPDSEMIDVTTLDAEDGWRAYMQGFRDAGELALTGFHQKDDSGQAALREAYGSGQAGMAEVEFPDGTVVGFMAYVKAYSVGAAEVDGAVGFGATLRLTGPVTVQVA